MHVPQDVVKAAIHSAFDAACLVVAVCYWIQDAQMPNWHSIWLHALEEASVATVLRVALDDPQASVVRAAAEALAVLIGPGAQVEQLWQAADDNPNLCKPSHILAWTGK